jgi:hypothetical protein
MRTVSNFKGYFESDGQGGPCFCDAKSAARIHYARTIVPSPLRPDNSAVFHHLNLQYNAAFEG